MRILGPARAPLSTVRERSAAVALAWFVEDVLPHVWAEAERLGVDPVGMWQQAIKETGGGRFGGAVSPKACNPCGLKITHVGLYGPATDGDQPAAHAMFPSWQVGARAQAQHLRAYAGWPLPADELVVDPRYVWLFAGGRPKHWCEHWSDLGGKWAPSPTYGIEIETGVGRLI
jgi:hypothetical protein